jgi:hypothetical protein
MSKKKFMEEVQAMPSPPSLSSTDDFPTFGLSELGRRLITEENESTMTAEVKEEKSLPPPPPPPTPPRPSSTTKQEKKEENKSTVQSTKKVSVVDGQDLVKLIVDYVFLNYSLWSQDDS